MEEDSLWSTVFRLRSALGSIHETTGYTISIAGTAGGESTTAWHVKDQRGKLHILKLHRDTGMANQYEFAAKSTARLRELAYPAPRYIATGATPGASYALIEKLPGVAARPMTAQILDQLIGFNELQRGQAVEFNDLWIAEMVDSIMLGRSGFCQAGTLLHHSPETADLMYQLREIADHARGIKAPCSDIVHFDYHPANVLSRGERITGIIDWDGTCTGDASFDLATILFYCYDEAGHRDVLVDEIVTRSGAAALGIYLAHIILRQVDWSIRHHDHATVKVYLSRAVRIIQYLDQNH